MEPGANVEKIRSRYLAHAIRRVRRTAEKSEVSARRAAEELGKYFEWVKDGLPAEDKTRLLREIQGLVRLPRG
jgi:hypothetical protein